MSSQDKTLIADLMESFVSEVPAKPFVTFCELCNKGVISEEMVYEKRRSFHKDCYDKYGKNFPVINQDLLNQSTNAKVELVQLKNLQERMKGRNSGKSTPIKKITKKSKRRAKQQKQKRRITTKKRKISKRRTIKKKLSRNRRITAKRRINRRFSKRRSSRRR